MLAKPGSRKSQSDDVEIVVFTHQSITTHLAEDTKWELGRISRILRPRIVNRGLYQLAKRELDDSTREGSDLEIAKVSQGFSPEEYGYGSVWE